EKVFKMKELDKSKVYDLSELTSEELHKVAKETKLSFEFLEIHKDTALLTFSYKWCMNANIKPEITHNAKELFYTLENVQVDCRELTEEQIKEMCKVYESNDYNQWNDNRALKLIDNYTYLRVGIGNEFYVNVKSSA